MKLNLNQYLNKTFNNLSILEYLKINNRSYFKCVCICGNIKNVRQDSIKNTKSCGCKNWENRKIKSTEEVVINILFAKYQKDAKFRKLKFELIRDQFINYIKRPCHYCNTEHSNSRSKRLKKEKFYFNGIDRKNSNLGYFIENCVPCCKICNVMKMAMGYDEFLKHIKKINDHRSL